MNLNYEYGYKKSKFTNEGGTFEFVYQEVMNSHLYETPQDEFQLCRYCGQSSPTKFLSKAHFIPEFTGNKNQLNFNECDDCNNAFSLYENSLKNFGLVNILLPIKGKKKFPVHRDNQNKTSTAFTNSETLITSIFKEETVFLENEIVKVKRSSTSFIPLYVQKALTKLAISMLPKEDLYYFKTLIAWLLDKTAYTNDDVEMLAFYTLDTKVKNLTPIANLYKRIANYPCPQYSLIFFWGYYKIQIFIPCNPRDIHLEKLTNIKLPISKTLKYVDSDKTLLQHIDLNIPQKTIASTASHHRFVNELDLENFKKQRQIVND